MSHHTEDSASRSSAPVVRGDRSSEEKQDQLEPDPFRDFQGDYASFMSLQETLRQRMEKWAKSKSRRKYKWWVEMMPPAGSSMEEWLGWLSTMNFLPFDEHLEGPKTVIPNVRRKWSEEHYPSEILPKYERVTQYRKKWKRHEILMWRIYKENLPKDTISRELQTIKTSEEPETLELNEQRSKVDYEAQREKFEREMTEFGHEIDAKLLELEDSIRGLEKELGSCTRDEQERLIEEGKRVQDQIRDIQAQREVALKNMKLFENHRKEQLYDERFRRWLRKEMDTLSQLPDVSRHLK